MSASRREFIKRMTFLGLGGLAARPVAAWIFEASRSGRLQDQNIQLGNQLATSAAGATELAHQNSGLLDRNSNLAAQGTVQANSLAIEQAKVQNAATQIAGLEIRLQDSLAASSAIQVKFADLKALSTQEAFGMSPYRIQATAEYYSRYPEQLVTEMARIPEDLKSNSVRIETGYINPQDNSEYANISGSGLITSFNTSTQEATILTAAHLFWNAPSHLRLNTFFLDQYQKPGYPWTQANPDEVSITCDPHGEDLAVVKAKLSSNPFDAAPALQSSIRVDTSWIPQVGDQLFSLSFPAAANVGQGVGYIPATFRVVEGISASRPEIICDSLVWMGASGAAVGRLDSQGLSVVGIYVATSKLGSYVVRLGDAYSRVTS